jgi:hypothetical protein
VRLAQLSHTCTPYFPAAVARAAPQRLIFGRRSLLVAYLLVVRPRACTPMFLRAHVSLCARLCAPTFLRRSAATGFSAVPAGASRPRGSAAGKHRTWCAASAEAGWRALAPHLREDLQSSRPAPLSRPSHGARSMRAFRRSRSLRLARRMAAATNGAARREKPLGSPRLRRLMRVRSSLMACQV